MGENKDLLTIKEFAEASGRSQQTIYRQITTRLAGYLQEIDGQKYIERRALEEVFHVSVEQPKQPELNNSFNPDNNPVDNQEKALYTILKQELDAKNQQIANLQKELGQERIHSREQADKFAVLADQAQKLQAAAMKQHLLEFSEDDEDPADQENSIDKKIKEAEDRIKLELETRYRDNERKLKEHYQEEIRKEKARKLTLREGIKRIFAKAGGD